LSRPKIARVRVCKRAVDIYYRLLPALRLPSQLTMTARRI